MKVAFTLLAVLAVLLGYFYGFQAGKREGLRFQESNLMSSLSALEHLDKNEKDVAVHDIERNLDQACLVILENKNLRESIVWKAWYPRVAQYKTVHSKDSNSWNAVEARVDRLLTWYRAEVSKQAK